MLEALVLFFYHIPLVRDVGINWGKMLFKGLGFMTETHLDTVYIYTERKGQRK